MVCKLYSFFSYRSPSGKLCKEPAIDCIEEVTEESSVNEVETPENVSAAVNAISKKSDGKKSDVSISSQRKNDDLENMEIAPILFAEDSEGKLYITLNMTLKNLFFINFLKMIVQMNYTC